MALLVSHSISYVNSTSFLSQLVLGRGQPNILNEAKKPIFEMMQGDTSDKIGGILAIGIVYICHHQKIDTDVYGTFLKQLLLCHVTKMQEYL